MTITEVVTGPDGRLYLALRKVKYTPRAANTIKEGHTQEGSHVIIIDPDEDDSQKNVIEFYV
jgi:hypothetical protein